MAPRVALLALLLPALVSSGDDRFAPDLELLVSTDAANSLGGGSTRAGLGAPRAGGDTGIEPAFDATGAFDATVGPVTSPAVPQLIDDSVDAPPPSPSAASPSSAPESGGHAVIRFGVVADAEGFDEADFWQRLADHLGVRANQPATRAPLRTRAPARTANAPRYPRTHEKWPHPPPRPPRAPHR